MDKRNKALLLIRELQDLVSGINEEKGADFWDGILNVKASQSQARTSLNRGILLAVADKLNGCSQDELKFDNVGEYYCVSWDVEEDKNEAIVTSWLFCRPFGTVYFKEKELAEKAIELCEQKFGKDFFKP